jgi:hypothetical protein
MPPTETRGEYLEVGSSEAAKLVNTALNIMYDYTHRPQHTTDRFLCTAGGHSM